MAELPTGVFFFGKYSLEIGRDVYWREAQIEIHFKELCATIRMNNNYQIRRDVTFTKESISLDEITNTIRIKFHRHEFALEPSQTQLFTMHWAKMGWSIALGHQNQGYMQATGGAGGYQSQGRPFPGFPQLSPFQSFPELPPGPSFLMIHGENTNIRAMEEQPANISHGTNQETLEATKRKVEATSSGSQMKRARVECELDQVD